MFQALLSQEKTCRAPEVNSIKTTTEENEDRKNRSSFFGLFPYDLFWSWMRVEWI